VSRGAIIEIVARKTSTTSNLRALTDEAELIRRCRAGERQAEEEFYQRFRNQVAANLYRVMNTRVDLDDLVQEVFVIAFRGLERFRGDARLSTWLYRICVNVALGRIRSKTRRPPPLLTDQPIGETVEASPAHPRELLEREQERARVYRILEMMPPKKRIVLFLHEIEGLDLKEIAFVLGVYAGTVRTRLFYARREFYRLVAEEGM
jgi:RNA polymerase sigma-70 factor (ECF subfamily)